MAKNNTNEILKEHTMLTYEVGKLKDRIIELNAKNQSRIQRQTNELVAIRKNTLKQVEEVLNKAYSHHTSSVCLTINWIRSKLGLKTT